MNEEEQANGLSDAIDSMLQGGEPELDLDDDDLIELLRIARLRHDASRALAESGVGYQELLLRVLKARMAARQMKQER
jgi:MoaA/NifB/PqqE/SkfB family radical SAM enzyme